MLHTATAIATATATATANWQYCHCPATATTRAYAFLIQAPRSALAIPGAQREAHRAALSPSSQRLRRVRGQGQGCPTPTARTWSRKHSVHQAPSAGWRKESHHTPCGPDPHAVSMSRIWGAASAPRPSILANRNAYAWLTRCISSVARVSPSSGEATGAPSARPGGSPRIAAKRPAHHRRALVGLPE